MDEKFDLLHSEMRAGFARLDAAGMRGEMVAFHRQVLYVVMTLWIGLVGLIAAQL